jgi:hypothetical protein
MRPLEYGKCSSLYFAAARYVFGDQASALIALRRNSATGLSHHFSAVIPPIKRRYFADKR